MSCLLKNLNFNTLILEENGSNNSIISLITDAVVGILGKKGLLGFGILLLLFAGLIAFLIYNQHRLGIVKKSKP